MEADVGRQFGMEGQGESVSSPDSNNLVSVARGHLSGLAVCCKPRGADEHAWKVAPKQRGLEGGLERVGLTAVRVAVDISIDQRRATVLRVG